MRNREFYLGAPAPLSPQVSRKIWGMPHGDIPWDFMPFLPASAQLVDGSVNSCVVFFGVSAFRRTGGMLPLSSFLDPKLVKDVSESPHQLLPVFAQKLYEGGETFMGGTDFTLVMKDGTTFYYVLGGVFEFIDYPDGYDKHDVAEVLRGVGRSEFGSRHSRGAMSAPPTLWCLYKEQPDTISRLRDERPRI